ncbi:hypothetical protein BYT27DRAFT_7233791 [Phlegmacium glaucopus]|nr:hypothetical protein BYT27DRAFT_7233791 [Phlegmacium glaucopus]
MNKCFSSHASRKAEQLAQSALRKGKLGNLSTRLSQNHHSLRRSILGIFYHAMPEGILSLQDLHHIASDIWLTRFDEDLEKEISARRKGRPKISKETKLFFGDKKELAFIQRLEYLAANPKVHRSILESTTVSEGSDAMDVVMEKQDPTVP